MDRVNLTKFGKFELTGLVSRWNFSMRWTMPNTTLRCWSTVLMLVLLVEGSWKLTGEAGKQAAILVPFGYLVAAGLIQFVRFRIAFLRICREKRNLVISMVFVKQFYLRQLTVRLNCRPVECFYQDQLRSRGYYPLDSLLNESISPAFRSISSGTISGPMLFCCRKFRRSLARLFWNDGRMTISLRTEHLAYNDWTENRNQPGTRPRVQQERWKKRKTKH